MKTKVTVTATFEPPATLGMLMAALDAFVKMYPNPGEGDRVITVQVDGRGRPTGFTVDNGTADPPVRP